MVSIVAEATGAGFAFWRSIDYILHAFCVDPQLLNPGIQWQGIHGAS